MSHAGDVVCDGAAQQQCHTCASEQPAGQSKAGAQHEMRRVVQADAAQKTRPASKPCSCQDSAFPLLLSVTFHHFSRCSNRGYALTEQIETPHALTLASLPGLAVHSVHLLPGTPGAPIGLSLAPSRCLAAALPWRRRGPRSHGEQASAEPSAYRWPVLSWREASVA